MYKSGTKSFIVAAVAVSLLNACPVSSQEAVPSASAATAQPVVKSAQLPVDLEVDLAKLLGNIDPTGWQPSALGAVQESDPDKLNLLREFGCQNAFQKSYLRGQRRIIVTVYAFNSTIGSYGAYNVLRRGALNVIVKGDASSEDNQSVSIWKDRYFISAFGTSEDDDESKEALTSIANQLCKVIPSRGELPPVIARLPGLDRVRGSEKVVMGPISARRLFPAPNLAMLDWRGALGGGMADYQMQMPYRERLKLLIVDFANADRAAQAFKGYTDALEVEHKNIDPDPIINQSALFKLANSFFYCQLKSNKVLMISGAHKRQSPQMLSHMVY